MMNFIKKSLWLLPLGLFAQEESQTYTLNKSVVSASGFAQELKEAPASISVVTKEQLEDRPFRDLAEAISNVPGVSIDTKTAQTGGYAISIRGMPTSYTLILVDGKRQNVTTSVFPNGLDDGVFTSFMPPLAAIERIEVIKGPMSTLYGSDAIGGVVNIITKRNFDKWSSSFTVETTLEEEKLFGNLYSGSFYTSGPIDSGKKWGLAIRGSEKYRAFVPSSDLNIVPDGKGGDKTIGRSKVVGLTESNIYNVGGRISYSPSEENYFYIDYQNSEQWINNVQKIFNPRSPDNLRYYQNNAIIAHIGSYSFGKTDTSLQYISASNPDTPIGNESLPKNAPADVKALAGKSRGLRGDDVILDGKLVSPFGKRWYANKLTVGYRYWFTSLRDKMAFENPFMYHHNAAIFAEDEWSFTDFLFLTLGIREDYNSAFGFHTSPRGYLVYNVFDWLTLKGGVSTGYKTPTVSQLIHGVNGVTGGGTSTAYGNPDLQPESSINYELSILSETDWTDLGVTGFFTDFRNKITSTKVSTGLDLPARIGGNCTGTESCSYNINTDAAITYGAEVFFAIKPINIVYGDVSLNVNYTFTKSKITKGSAKGTPLTFTPEHSLNGAINYNIWKLGFYIRGEFKGKQFKYITSENILSQLRAKDPNYNPYYKDFGLLHIGGHYNITNSIRLHAGIYNLLNHNFVDFEKQFVAGRGGKISESYENNYQFIREGRRYFISLNMDF
ncbi:TonB-dependent receptor domain-containing protein [Helicobacter cappadocius]|uniref:TonB-dependent receptor n=1 Tax=Helicobacter cappadocius TaxID=3063998 RepID=A0AA90PY73_9HELI|nr:MULTISPECIES: TonB-dependent receptor [unclassified Helicobacter]MDO7253161.1 TonB-dependent receptor [Helicobacter sp. faydin-H75]MDP2538713.1 TonB-dependent receptor [Helicobacter sp. faydin-H76]